VFRKRAAPSVGKIEVGHVEHEHGIVVDRPSSKKASQPAPEIVFTLFCFHDDFLLVNANRQGHGHHAAVAGFCSPSFEGANKSGATGAELVTCYPDYLR
jgi:hypothetical protein